MPIEKMAVKYEEAGTVDLKNNICYVDIKKYREVSVNRF